MSIRLPFRQVHLDFHTGPEIPAVGNHFEPEAFAGTLARAQVNSATCFARCHHSLIYYHSERFPERVHPRLQRLDLLLEQIEACHRQERRTCAQAVIDRWKLEMSAFVRQQPGYTPECTIFYNTSHVNPKTRPVRGAYTHFELESLPSGGWGYLHFPVAPRYTRTLNAPYLGMTGKFHTSWGDFHSFANEAALEFECFRALALARNGKCSIGDQLLPDGRLCPHTYDLIGSVYRQVAPKEPWCRSADAIPVSAGLRQKLDDYLQQGGALLATFASRMDRTHTRFELEALGVTLASEGPRDRQGLLARGRLPLS